MKKILLSFLLILVFCLIAFSQEKSEEIKEEIIDVNFCDLTATPSEYATKIVRVTGIYRFGFEWSDFYCPSCKRVVSMNFDNYDRKLTNNTIEN
jgi:hypothetical protein